MLITSTVKSTVRSCSLFFYFFSSIMFCKKTPVLFYPPTKKKERLAFVEHSCKVFFYNQSTTYVEPSRDIELSTLQSIPELRRLLKNGKCCLNIEWLHSIAVFHTSVLLGLLYFSTIVVSHTKRY